MLTFPLCEGAIKEERVRSRPVVDPPSVVDPAVFAWVSPAGVTVPLVADDPADDAAGGATEGAADDCPELDGAGYGTVTDCLSGVEVEFSLWSEFLFGKGSLFPSRGFTTVMGDCRKALLSVPYLV